MRAVAVALFAAVLAGLSLLASAQAPEDPPARVGRVSLITGAVSLYADPEHGWEKAYVNSPLTSENSLWTEPRARTEVRVGSTTLRLDETTQLDMRRLGDEELRAHVVRGSLSVRVRDLERGERYLISTPNARFEITAPGRYRIDADEDRGESLITVFAGSALVDASRRAPVEAGDAVRVMDDGSRFEFERAAGSPFDDWALARDERVERTTRETVRYVSPQMTGYEDLGEFGSWATEPDYGAIWYPTAVAVGYVPYRDGRWVYTRPWGWTWVDNAPWGYAPFHYGRWVYVGNRWGWCPGRYVARPVWAPALVGWVGGSSGFSITVSGGRAPAMGWYPLSPYDRYRPWYTNNTTYINNVNVVVNRPPRDWDRNRDRNREHGSTVVLREDFVQQRPVAQGVARVPGAAVREAASAPVSNNPVAVLPPRTAVQRPPVTAVPGQAVGGQTVGGAPVRGQPAQSGGVATTKPAFVSPAPPPAAPVAPPPARVGGEPVRGERAAKPAPGTQAVNPGTHVTPAPPVSQPNAVTPAPVARPTPQPALRARPAPVEVHEAPARVAPQPVQPVQQGQPVQHGQPVARPAPAAPAAAKPAPAPAEKPQPDDKNTDKPEKPGRSSGGREK